MGLFDDYVVLAIYGHMSKPHVSAFSLVSGIERTRLQDTQALRTRKRTFVGCVRLMLLSSGGCSSSRCQAMDLQMLRSPCLGTSAESWPKLFLDLYMAESALPRFCQLRQAAVLTSLLFDVDQADREGLPAYASLALPDDLLCSSQSLQIRSADPAVVETLRGLDQELQGSTLATLQDWLRNLVKVILPEHGCFRLFANLSTHTCVLLRWLVFWSALAWTGAQIEGRMGQCIYMDAAEGIPHSHSIPTILCT